MTGGGARAAYQVGVLRALAELLPPDVDTPFPIICGTSAGAINAAVIAVDALEFPARRAAPHDGVEELPRASRLPRRPAGRALEQRALDARAADAAARPQRGRSRCSTTRRSKELLARYLDFSAIQRAIDARRPDRVQHHLLGLHLGTVGHFLPGPARACSPGSARAASAFRCRSRSSTCSRRAALPFIFPPVHINREYFGDGSMRQIAPVSPALHLGADRLFVIGVGRQLQPQRRTASRVETHPSLAQIAGHALNSIFLDSLEVDLERLQRINRTLEIIPRELLEKSNYPLHRVDFRVITPSEELEKIAVAHRDELPRTIRALLLHGGGHAQERREPALLPAVRALLLPRAHPARLQRHDGAQGRAGGVPRLDLARPCPGRRGCRQGSAVGNARRDNATRATSVSIGNSAAIRNFLLAPGLPVWVGCRGVSGRLPRPARLHAPASFRKADLHEPSIRQGK